ncbi:CAAX amino terminal protease family (Precursor) [Petrimonas sp. IBARAKI]|nr:CAAX amino terminal protease family (Precursor) [Petrimonas sp. IBARAKI]
MKIKSMFLLTVVVIFSVSLLFIGKWAETMHLFDSLPSLINKNIVYQSTTLALALILLIALRVTHKTTFTEHFKKGNISAPILPELWIGIRPKSNENWKNFGRNLAVIITMVTAIIIFFQVIKQGEIHWMNWVRYLPFVLFFAVVNSFVEEIITRLSVVVSLKNSTPHKIIPIVSAILFGTIHFWGTPGGFFGVLFAGFLGWFLAKSIIETKGIYWAWLIHFLQDVVIFSAMVLMLNH